MAPFGVVADRLAALTGVPSERPGHRCRRRPVLLGRKPGPGRPVSLVRPVEPADRPPPPHRGPTSRWPRAATATAASVPSRRSGASSAPAPPSRSWPRWTSWPVRTARSGRWSWWPRTSPRSPSTAPPGGPCPGSTVRPSAATARSSTWWGRWPSGSTGSGSSISTRPRSTTRWSRPSWPPGSRTSTSRSSTCRARCSSACGAGARGTGSSTGSPRSGRAEPTAAFRSSFIVGYPGETEADHDQLLEWLAEAQLDWVGFFPFSNEAGTYAADLDGPGARSLVAERLRECTELQDAITARPPGPADRARPSRSWSTRPARDAPTGRHRRSTGSSRCPTTCLSARSPRWWSPGPTAPTWWPSRPRAGVAPTSVRPLAGGSGSGRMSDGAVPAHAGQMSARTTRSGRRPS